MNRDEGFLRQEGSSTTGQPKLNSLCRLASRTAAALLLLAVTAISSPAQMFKSLVSFDVTDGERPSAGLVQGRDGSLYGITDFGGVNGAGTVFRITPEGQLTTLYNFCEQTGCSDGSNPGASLVLAADGNLYGTTFYGGVTSANCATGCGTVFEITATGRLTTLYAFCVQTGCPDGYNPDAALVQATDGNFYGTTYSGGSNGNYGTVFRITPAGMLSTLHSFCSRQSCLDGNSPLAGLVQGPNGSLYGTTIGGGRTGWGTVFAISAAGKLTTIYNFCVRANCYDGAYPEAGLVQGTDGNFYGTTFYGGFKQLGTVFKITATGKLTTIYSFCPEPRTGCPDGSFPYAGLVQGSDGMFYGTSLNMGVPKSYATIFRITPTGTLTTLYSFRGPDGSQPYAGLVQSTDGVFYGTTYYGGADIDGTVYALGNGLRPFIEPQPTSGKVGSRVIILGTDLTGTTAVSFNGTAASFVASDSAIETTVPLGATSGTITVTKPSGILPSNVVFRVTP
jgi:uncharacterized repeat protein (TIGR03803 family)